MRAAKIDANQPEIVAALRKAGFSVVSLARAGGGVPDLLVGRAGRNYLLEVKEVSGKLRVTQELWHRAWRGQVATVRTAEEAIAAVQGDHDDWK